VIYLVVSGGYFAMVVKLLGSVKFLKGVSV